MPPARGGEGGGGSGGGGGQGGQEGGAALNPTHTNDTVPPEVLEAPSRATNVIISPCTSCVSEEEEEEEEEAGLVAAALTSKSTWAARVVTLFSNSMIL